MTEPTSGCSFWRGWSFGCRGRGSPLRPADLNRAETNFAPRVGFGWHAGGDQRMWIRGGYGMYYTQIRSKAVAGSLVNGLDGLTTYTAVPGQLGFPTCLTGSCLRLSFDPRTLPPSQLPGARHHDPGGPARLLP